MGSENDDESVSWSCWLRTLFAASGSIFVFVFVGVTEVHSAVMLPQLRKPDSFIYVTPDEETWIASLGIIMSQIAAIFTGPFIDAFGRKKGLQYFYLNMALGFGVMAFAQNVWHIYIGRIICGIGTGLELCPVVYVAEICNEKQRSVLFSTNSAMYASGGALCTLLCGYLPWTFASLIFSIACLAFFILEFFIPESPPWLYNIGKEDACTKSFQRLGRNQPNIQRELDTLKLTTKNDSEKVEWQTFLKPTVWKPFVIMSTFFILHSASGLFDVIYYTVDFVERIGTSYDPLTISVILSGARFLAVTTIGVYLWSTAGRKLTLALSALGMAVGFLGTGAYEYVYRDTDIWARPGQWFPVVCLVVEMAMGEIGVLCLPWMMTGEMFPLSVRGTMTGVCYVVGYGTMFISIKMYYVLLETLQIHGLLLAFSVPCFVCVLFGIYVLPETQRKSLFEIEQSFLPEKDRLRMDPSSQEKHISAEKF